MLCPRCHTENCEARRFCSKCAAPLAVVCASCGFTDDPGDEFCGGCAQSLRAGTQMPRKFQSPESYTRQHLAEKILTSKAALEGERKQAGWLMIESASVSYGKATPYLSLISLLRRPAAPLTRFARATDSEARLATSIRPATTRRPQGSGRC